MVIGNGLPLKHTPGHFNRAPVALQEGGHVLAITGLNEDTETVSFDTTDETRLVDLAFQHVGELAQKLLADPSPASHMNAREVVQLNQTQMNRESKESLAVLSDARIFSSKCLRLTKPVRGSLAALECT